MLSLTPKSPLHIEMIDFALRGVTILRQAPGPEYAIVAGPYFAAELGLLRGALQQCRGARDLALREEDGGVCIYRRRA